MKKEKDRLVICQQFTQEGGMKLVYCCEAFQDLFYSMKEVWDGVKKIRGVFNKSPFVAVNECTHGKELTILAFCPICGRPYDTVDKKKMESK